MCAFRLRQILKPRIQPNSTSVHWICGSFLWWDLQRIYQNSAFYLLKIIPWLKQMEYCKLINILISVLFTKTKSSWNYQTAASSNILTTNPHPLLHDRTPHTLIFICATWNTHLKLPYAYSCLSGCIHSKTQLCYWKNIQLPLSTCCSLCEHRNYPYRADITGNILSP